MSLFSLSDVAAFRSDYMAEPAKRFFPDATWSDAFVLAKLQAAEQDVSKQLKVFLEPTQIFPTDPTSDQITALSGMPYFVEPGYDYDPGFFDGERWGYIVTRQKPIISVQSIIFAYPAPTNGFYTIPSNWLRIDKKYGHIRLVPASSAFSAPLGAFLMQALGGGLTIPSMIQVTYQAGLQDAKNTWPALMDVIYKMAILKMIQDTWVPNSESISADGLSQSISVAVKDWNEAIDRLLFGPKGANGGLYTAIHGLSNTVMGIVV